MSPIGAESLWLWFLSQAVLLIAAGVAAHLRLLALIGKLESDLRDVQVIISDRVSKLEGFNEAMAKHFAHRLHRDDDKYGMDKLLETYAARHNELSVGEWVELHQACDKILSRPDLSNLEFIGYSWLKLLAEHKAGPFIPH